ncbi:Venom serine protease 34 [Eumeta japonica]|uniref:Venom serine protease 34 n=1 Tax=Eumeta variegata TaxID=151549 RepID=A0A4C1U4S4_EUMVA|nr:Venom serine protease 34 [Eumeta japonica]
MDSFIFNIDDLTVNVNLLFAFNSDSGAFSDFNPDQAFHSNLDPAIRSLPQSRFQLRPPASSLDSVARPVFNSDTTATHGSDFYKAESRIVGGEETDINEFPAMAGVVDVTIYQIKCGGIIIASGYVLTAAHCLSNRKVNETAVVVGEHDVNTGDSPVTQVLKVKKFILHSQYNSIPARLWSLPSDTWAGTRCERDNYDYDVGLVRTLTDIVFSDRVGPICLPFKFYNRSFTGDKVTALGWGTLFPGGPTSNVLRKVTLDVISQESCQQKMSNVTPRQMCTHTQGKDACQDDSGGPLLYTDPSSGWMFSVGIISYGRFCASDEPGINTRVTSILDWIVAMTPDVTYCKK